MSEQACAAEQQYPRRAMLTRALLPLLLRLESRRSEYGDEKPLGLPGGLWLYAYRWSYRGYSTSPGWWRDWHLLVGWRGGHRSFYLGDERAE